MSVISMDVQTRFFSGWISGAPDFLHKLFLVITFLNRSRFWRFKNGFVAEIQRYKSVFSASKTASIQESYDQKQFVPKNRVRPKKIGFVHPWLAQWFSVACRERNARDGLQHAAPLLCDPLLSDQDPSTKLTLCDLGCQQLIALADWKSPTCFAVWGMARTI